MTYKAKDLRRTDLLKDAVERASEEFDERIDYELMGAWRMGYDYVHVYTPYLTAYHHPEESFSVRQYVLPSSSKRAPRPSGLKYDFTYDIGSVPDEEIRGWIEDQ